MSSSQDGIRYCNIEDRGFIARRMNDAFQGHLSDTVWPKEAARKNKEYRRKGNTVSKESSDSIGQSLVVTSIRDFAWHNALIDSKAGKDAAAIISFPIREPGDAPSRFTNDPLVVQLGNIEAKLPNSLYVAFLAVKKEFMGKGIAKALLNHAVTTSRAKALGELVSLIVNSGNANALAFYNKYGFSEIPGIPMNPKGAKTWKAAGTHWICMRYDPN